MLHRCATHPEFEFQHHPSVNPADCREPLGLSEDQFQTRFGKMPLSRPGRAGLLRNAAIVLGNLRAIEAEPELIASLNDTEPLIRGAAAWALGQLATPPTRAAVRSRLTVETDTMVREELTAVIGNH